MLEAECCIYRGVLLSRGFKIKNKKDKHKSQQNEHYLMVKKINSDEMAGMEDSTFLSKRMQTPLLKT
jgi:hypothetical protein